MYKLLLVEDDLSLLDVTYERIVSCIPDVKVTTATSGNEAISLFDSGDKYDFIVSDYNMPHGNGLKLLEYINNSDYQGFFVFYSSELQPIIPIKIRIFFLGVVDKIEFHNLIDCIQRHL